MKYNFRTGIAMIELIFAIVVMGIAMLSAPLILSQATKSNYVAFQQESIAIASSHLNSVMSYSWDEQNTPESVTADNLLTVSSGDTALDENNSLRGTTTLKTLPQQRRRRFSPLTVNASAIGADSGDLDDIDDFNGVESNLTLYSPSAYASNKGNYINLTTILTTTVTYAVDTASYNASTSMSYNIGAASINSTNIKHVSTTLVGNSADTDLNQTTITLQAFTCNIGTSNPFEQGGY